LNSSDFEHHIQEDESRQFQIKRQEAKNYFFQTQCYPYTHEKAELGMAFCHKMGAILIIVMIIIMGQIMSMPFSVRIVQIP
jgi:hypothetical protein